MTVVLEITEDTKLEDKEVGVVFCGTTFILSFMKTQQLIETLF
jgi:hypothetical protein